MSETSIRPLALDDREIWEAFWRDYHHNNLHEEPGMLWQRLFRPDAVIKSLLALSDGLPAGFAHYIIQESSGISRPYCFLNDLYVAPEHRRKGIAKHLLGWLHDQAAAHNWRSVYWITQSTNLEAQNLYDQIAERTGWIRYEMDPAEPYRGDPPAL